MSPSAKRSEPTIGIFIAFITYLAYALLIAIGHIRDFIGKAIGLTRYAETKTTRGYGRNLAS